jgi:DNA-binding NtrC family response regulator
VFISGQLRCTITNIYIWRFALSETVLIIDDDPDVLQASALALRHLGFNTLTHRQPDVIPALLAAHDIGAIVLDLNFQRGATSSAEGLRWLSEIRRLDADAAVVVITAHGGVKLAVEAMKLGATDFITKPWSNERLVTTVSNAVQLRATRRAAERSHRQARELSGGGVAEKAMLIGDSPAMQHVQSLITRAAPTDANVLILGENGTGKELVARALHNASKRVDEVMISVDLGAVTASLFESELFGHKKGAFTDAKTDRIGRFAAAHRGTLFLDEIGNLPLTLQPKLLSVLEQRQIIRVGANAPENVDVRVISATNLSRDQLADEKQFRPDLLFRLNTVEIHIPPLRQRREDIAVLAAHFLNHYAQKYEKTAKGFSASALRAIEQYDWPGNVRALRHAIERAVILGNGAQYSIEDLALSHAAKPTIIAPTTLLAEDDDLNLERMEKLLVERALNKHAWNISLTAKDLGLTRASLYRRMERFNL